MLSAPAKSAEPTDKSSEAPTHRRTSAPTREHAGAQGHARPPSVARHAGNMAVQRLVRSDRIQAKLAVGAPGDMYEREADRVADTLLSSNAPTHVSSAPPRVQRKCAECAAGGSCPKCEEEQQRLQAKEKPGRTPRASKGLSTQVAGLRGGGRPLPGTARDFFEPRLGADLSGVRVHTDAAASRTASRLGARAFTAGSDIAFAPGEYRPESPEGQRLLAHELTHVLQQDAAGEGPTVRRWPDENGMDNEAGVCTEEEQVEAQQSDEPLTCEQPPEPAGLSAGGELDERIRAFKKSVTTMAIHRLIGNQRSLDLWAALVKDRIPDDVIAATGLKQSGGYGPYMELQDMRNPMMRELRAEQAMGRFRACTGCHLEVRAHEYAGSVPHIGPEWQSPNERRYGTGEAEDAWGTGPLHISNTALLDYLKLSQANTPGDSPTDTTTAAARPTSYGYTPPPSTTAEGALQRALPDPTRVLELMQQAEPILVALGSEGYKVLPDTILMDLRGGSMEGVRKNTLSAITQRQKDFDELIGMIRNGRVTWEKFGPIINDLLPMADPDVRDSIKEEMDHNAFWDKVEAVVVGILSIAALILTIFPPTSALGITMFGALEFGLATYGLVKGPEMIETGYAYSLAKGAHNVFYREQQESGGMMMLGGILGMVLAPLGMVSGSARMATGLSRFGTVAGESTALIRAGEAGLLGGGRTLESGEWVISMADDGAIVATSTRRPELLVIIRGDTATLYQSMGPGGMRVLESASVSEMMGGAGALKGTPGLPGSSPPLLTAGEGMGELSVLPTAEECALAQTPTLAPRPPALPARPLLLPPPAEELASANQCLAVEPAPFQTGGVSSATGPMAPTPYNPSGLATNCGYCSISRALARQGGEGAEIINADQLYLRTLEDLGLPLDTANDPVSRMLAFPDRLGFEGAKSRPGYEALFSGEGNRMSDYTITQVAQARGLNVTPANETLDLWSRYFSGPLDEVTAARLEALEEAGRTGFTYPQLEASIARQRALLPGDYIIGSTSNQHFMNLTITAEGRLIAEDVQVAGALGPFRTYEGLADIEGRMGKIDFMLRVEGMR